MEIIYRICSPFSALSAAEYVLVDFFPRFACARNAYGRHMRMFASHIENDIHMP